MPPARPTHVQRAEREAARSAHTGPWHIGEILPAVLAAVLGEPAEREPAPQRGPSTAAATVTPAVVPQPWWSQSWQPTTAAALFGQTG